MAVDEDDSTFVVLVVVRQVVDHERRAVVRGHRVVAEQLRRRRAASPAHVGAATLEFMYWVATWPSKTFLKYVGNGVVHVEEVRHVDDVVDDLAAVGVDDRSSVPDPVGPLVAEPRLDAGDRHVVGRRVALGVVPDEQHAVLLEGRPGAGPGPRRDAACVGDRLALAVAAPAPVVERAGDLVALDRALGQVAAHVTAVARRGR